MADSNSGLPEFNPGRIPERPLAQPKRPEPAPMTIPNQKFAAPADAGQSASQPLSTKSISEPDSRLRPAADEQTVAPLSPKINPTQLLAQEQTPAQATNSTAAPLMATTNSPESINPPPAFSSKRNWAEAKRIGTYYLSTLNAILFSPASFFRDVTKKSKTEAGLFLVISAGIYSILRVLFGDSNGLFAIFGAIFYVLIAAVITAYGLKYLMDRGNFTDLLKILAFSQAPLIVGWISFGPLPIGIIVATIYSIYLSVVGVEEIYKVHRTQSTIIIVIASLIAKGLGALLHIG